MQQPFSLKSVERQVFRATLADGLWEVLIGCVVLELAIAPLLGETMGDFWSSAVFLPFWGLVYAVVWWVRKHVLAPRLGSVNLSQQRQKRLRSFRLVMILVNALLLLLGIVALVFMGQIPGGVWTGGMSLLFLAGFSLAAYFLDYTRLYGYGALMFAAPLVGEWLYTNYGVAHHGFPVVFGGAAGAMIVIGLVTFVRLLKDNPLPEIPPEGV